MKKLMTMIAAVAMSFGLFAGDTLNNSVSFATATNENPYATGDSLWAYTKDGASTAILKDEVQVKDHALVLETGSKVLSRKFAEQRVPFPENEEKLGEKGSLYANMTLDFNGEALEEIPDIGNSKIALFALDTSDWDQPTGEGELLPEQGTNIFVLASYGNPAQKALFQLKNFDSASLANERTVALKAYENVLSGTGQCGGFLLYINHSGDTGITPVSVSAVYLFDANDKVVWVDVINGENGYLGRTDINGKLAKWTAGKNLFVSLDASPDTWNSLASVDFSGRAALSEITLANADDEDNPWPADLVSMALSLTDATIELTQESKNEGFAVVDGAVTHPTGGEFSFTVSGDYGNFTVLNGTAPVTPDAEGVYTTTLTDGGLLTVKSWEAAALVNGEPVESLFGADGAIAKVNQNGGTLKLMGAATALAETDKFEFNCENEVILDLAGQTLTVYDGQALGNFGKLTIMDSLTGGNIVGDVENVNALVISNGVFNGALVNTYGDTDGVTTIYGGTFNDTVENFTEEAEDPSTIKIIAKAGNFVKYDKETGIGTDKETVLTFIDQDNYELDEEVKPGYYTVVPMANYVAQIGDTKFKTLADAIAAAATGDTVTLLKSIETAAKEQWTIAKNITIDFADKTITKTVANDWVFTVANGAEVTFTGTAGGIVHYPAVLNQGNPASMIQILGKLTVNGGVYESDYTVLKVDEGEYAAGEVVVTGGTFTIAPRQGTTYTGKTYAVMNWSKATLTGGTFTGNVVTLSCDGNKGVQAGETIVGTIAGTPNYILEVGFKGDTTCNNLPKIKGVQIDDVTLVKVDSIDKQLKLVQDDEYVTVAEKAFYDITFKVEGATDYVTNVVEGTELATVKPADPEKEGFEFKGWEPEVTGVAESNATYTAKFEAIASGITITVTLGTGIASVTVDDQKITKSGDVELDEAGKVTITLAADSTFTIPVFKVSKAEVGANVTPKTAEYDVADGDAFTFTVEEAKEDDPQVTEEQKKTAIIDAIDAGESHDAAVAKVNQVVTTEETPAVGKVTATELATWIKDKSISSTALASSDYIVASVKLDVAPITESTPVKVEKAEAATGNLEFAIKVNGQDVTSVDQVGNFVQLCDDLGVAGEWKKLPESTLKDAVSIANGKLVITPVAGVDKLFLKVVIPQDAK